MFSFLKQEKAAGPTAEQIVPRIKHVNFLQAMQKIAAQQPGAIPLTKTLVADLLVTYAYDLPGAFAMMPQRDLDRLGMTLDQVHSMSLRNLRRTLSPIAQKGTPPLFQLTVGNNLEACLLLIDELWDKRSKKVEGKLVAVAASRDIVLFTGSDSPQGLTKMRDLARQVRQRESVHGLSESLLLWNDRKWSVFDI